MNFSRYLILTAIALTASCGDVCLGMGMKQIGVISFANWKTLLFAVANPWVAGGVVLLLGFLASYFTALSWADLSYVLPATSLNYAIVALLSRVFLHEQVTIWRWTGILMLILGTGFVTGGPSLTTSDSPKEPNSALTGNAR